MRLPAKRFMRRGCHEENGQKGAPVPWRGSKNPHYPRIRAA
jgi:hypothetical protein